MRRKVCHGKKKFETAREAVTYAGVKERRYRARRCQFCGAWHVDTVINDRKRRARCPS